jgi:hypothetical protein
MLAHRKKTPGGNPASMYPPQRFLIWTHSLGPSHKAHGRLRGLFKQGFQRAFMPQRGRLRSRGVCGFEPTDPPPARESLFEVCPVGRATSKPSARFFAAKLWAFGGTNRIPKRKIKGGFECDSGMIQTAHVKPGDILQLSVDNEAVVPVGKIVRVEVTASTLFPAG